MPVFEPAKTGADLRRRWVITVTAIAVLLVVTGFVVRQFQLAAIAEPGRTEAAIATKAKHFLVGRESRDGVPNEPQEGPISVAEGDKLFGAECAICHGMNARTPSETGRWMYPRASNLASPEVQTYSNRELFWIVKNGIRLSGMPAFGKVESDEHIWSLVHFVRSLNTPAHSNVSAAAR